LIEGPNRRTNGQNCSILSQKVPELYKHNDELFSIYYRIFYEPLAFAYFDRVCKPFSIFSLAAILVGSRDQRTQFWKGAIQESFQQNLVPFKIVSDSPALHSRWPLLLKIEISSNGQNCPILSQNVPKFELYKHNESFQQNLVDIGSVVSEEKIFFKFHPPFFLICIIGQNRQKFEPN
jgi:hypothetical protein